MRYQLPVGGQLEAEFRVGQEFEGSAYVYLPGRTARFQLLTRDGARQIEAEIGDRPALNLRAPGEGLMVAVHETTDYPLTYDSWDTFMRFVAHKDLGDIETIHMARGLPKERVREAYRRCAKALFAVGHGRGADALVGMPIEFLALDNPYTDDLSGGMEVQLLREGVPLADTQVEVFEKAPDGSVIVFKSRTDATGRSAVPVKAGHEYLVDAVVLVDTGSEDMGEEAAWRSLWASLTFEVPE